MATMFTNDEWESVLVWAREKIRSELERKSGQAKLCKSTGIPSATVNRWRRDSATPREPSQKKVQLVIEDHWKMNRADVLREAMGVESVSPIITEPVKRRGKVPKELAEAISLRLDRWLGSTIDALRGIADNTGLRCSVGGWIDAGDELDRQRRAECEAAVEHDRKAKRA